MLGFCSNVLYNTSVDNYVPVRHSQDNRLVDSTNCHCSDYGCTWGMDLYTEGNQRNPSRIIGTAAKTATVRFFHSYSILPFIFGWRSYRQVIRLYFLDP